MNLIVACLAAVPMIALVAISARDLTARLIRTGAALRQRSGGSLSV